jgi:hypothetical protein
MPSTQCPRCTLTFTSRSEMQWHLRAAHSTRQATESSPVTIVLEVMKDPTPVRSDWSRFWQNLRRGRSG